MYSYFVHDIILKREIELNELTKAAQHALAPDVWDSAPFSGIFLASGFFCSRSESCPAPPAANANRWPARIGSAINSRAILSGERRKASKM